MKTAKIFFLITLVFIISLSRADNKIPDYLNFDGTEGANYNPETGTFYTSSELLEQINAIPEPPNKEPEVEHDIFSEIQRQGDAYEIPELKEGEPLPDNINIFQDHIDKLKSLEEKKKVSFKDYFDMPTVFISFILLLLAITAYYKIPKIFAKFKATYSKININEGRKRLRILLSVLAAILFYFYLYMTEYSLENEEIFFQFPLLSLVMLVFIFIITTAFYWVLDGFKNNQN